MLYEHIDVCRRLGDGELVVYRCWRTHPEGMFIVQSADHIRLPISRDETRIHDLQLWQLMAEEAPEVRSEPYESLEAAIEAFEIEFGDGE